MEQRHRQKESELARKQGQRSSNRILIVCEGEKTEPNYFNNIRKFYRLSSTCIEIRNYHAGTAPIQIVKHAQDVFNKGDPHRGILPRDFDFVYAVFDRDNHESYFQALDAISSLNEKNIKSTQKKIVRFSAIVSIPSFELWLLLHFEDIYHPIHRDDVMKKLKIHLPGYEKSDENLFEKTSSNWQDAHTKALRLKEKSSQKSDGPYTDVGVLVEKLIHLKEIQ